MRTEVITYSDYQTILTQLFEDYHETHILDAIHEGYFECDLDEEKHLLSDFLNDAWHDPPFSTATYESLATHANPHQSPAFARKTDSISPTQNAKSTIDSLTLVHIKQELHDILDYYETEYHSMHFLHDTFLNTLLKNNTKYPTYTDPTSIHTAFVQWLRQERTNEASPVNNTSTIDPAAFTPEHITSHKLLNPHNSDLHTALLWWLYDMHPETLTAFGYFESPGTSSETISPRILYPSARDRPEPDLNH